MYCPECGRIIPDNPADTSCSGCGYDPEDPDCVAAREEAGDHRRRSEVIL